METLSKLTKPLGNKRGVTIILVAIVIFALIGFAALAIDVGHLLVVRNELKNAADAGALAGAQALYNNNGTSVNCGANKIAFEAATQNKSDNVNVDVNWPVVECDTNNDQEIQRGHWSFSTNTFSENSSLQAIDIWDYSYSELDNNVNFINAVRVVARRSDTPAVSFFARIFGFENFLMSVESVGYIGFSGSLNKGDVDQPLAICQQSILDFNTDHETCTVGRMINSGKNATAHNTSGWTNYSQPCHTASGNEMRTLICSEDPNNPPTCTCESSNPLVLKFGDGMGATGGEQEGPSFDSFRACWRQAKNDENKDPADGREAPIDTNGDGIPDKAWEVVLPVVDCPGSNVSNCPELIGAVALRILWVTEKNEDPHFLNVPIHMAGENWDCKDLSKNPPEAFDRSVKASDLTEAQRMSCWEQFREKFNLLDVDNNYAAYNNKSIYFQPSCDAEDLRGKTGGKNFGILAKYPVLVK